MNPARSECDARARLRSALAPDVVEALEALIADEIRVALAASAHNAPALLTLVQAASRLDCTPEAVRMRVKRGRLVGHRQGRRLYVTRASVDGLVAGA